jgi:uncharacterized protein (TIGR03437 family)
VVAIAGQTVAVAQAGVPIPQFRAGSITSAASGLPGTSPGSLVTIYGTGLTRNVNGVVVADHTPLPADLAGTSVEFAAFDNSSLKYVHRFAPLSAIANVGGQEQINLQIPWELASSSVEIAIHNNGFQSGLMNYGLRPTNPGVFTIDGTAGAIVHGADNMLVTSGSPASRGEVIVIYATGLGAVNPPSPTGQPAAAAEPLSRTVATPIVTIGGATAQVLFSGLTPNFVGLYQLNVVVPPNSAVGNVPVVVAAAGIPSKPVTILVQ